MGSTESEAEVKQSEEEKEKNAIILWKKVKRFSTLIAKLKVKAENGDNNVTSSRLDSFEHDSTLTCAQRIVIDPSNSKKEWFDLFVSFCTLTDLVFSSYTLFIDEHMLLGLYLMTGVLFVDIILKFVQGYFSGTTQIISLRTIVIHYLTGYFIFDFLAVIPLFIFEINLIYLRFLKLLRFQEVTTRIVDWFYHKVLESVMNINKATLAAIKRLSRFIITLMVFLHIFACAFVKLGQADTDGWIASKADKLSSNSDGTLYLAGLYWAITTFATIGYGEFSGTNTNDFLFSMGVFLFGVGMFSYLLGNVNSLVAQLNYEENLKCQQAEGLEDWLLHIDRAGKGKHVSEKQCNFLTTYLNHYWVKNIKGIDSDNEFAKQLPPSIRKKLFTKHLFQDVYKIFNNYFSGHHPEFVKDLVLRMEYFKIMRQNEYNMGNIIVQKAGKVPKFVYFLYAGKLQLSSVDAMTNYITLHEGGVFGDEYSLFGTRSTYCLISEVKNQEKSSVEKIEPEAYKVKTEEYFEILKRYSEMLKVFKNDALNKRRIYRKMKKDFLINSSEITFNFSPEEREENKEPASPETQQLGAKRNKSNMFSPAFFKLSHRDRLMEEYNYNSEDEDGTKDVFEKSESNVEKDHIEEQVQMLNDKMRKLKEKIQEIEMQTFQFLEDPDFQATLQNS